MLTIALAVVMLGCGAGLIITGIKFVPSGATTPAGYSTGLAYSYNDTTLTATITGFGTCNDEHIMIPPTVTNNGKTYQVTALGKYAFRGGVAKRITLPEGWTTITPFAFYQSEVRLIDFPASLTTIYAQALAGAQLKDLVLPVGLKTIDGSYVFHSMARLETVRFLGNTKFNNNTTHLFNANYRLREVYLPNTVATFTTYMFGGCVNLETLVIGDQVTSMPYTAFVQAEDKANVAKIQNIYYGGTPAQKAAISMPNGDDGAINPAAVAQWYYYSATPNFGDSSGNQYWHYDTDGNVMLWRDSDLRQAVVSGVESSYVYTGEAIVPTLKVTMGDRVLTNGVDYYVTVNDNVNVGAANYTVTGMGNYAGTIDGNFTITAQVVNRPVADSTVYTYNGEPQTYQLPEHSAYIITGNDPRTAAGTYNVVVSLKNGNYQWDDGTNGKLTYQFHISPQVLTLPTVYHVALDANDTLKVADQFVDARYTVQSVRNADDLTDENEYLGQAVSSGSYQVTLALTDSNYRWVTGSTTTYTTELRITTTYQANELTGDVQIDGWTYGDSTNQPTGVTARYGAPSYYFTADQQIADSADFAIGQWTAWTADRVLPAGEYYVIAYVPATDPQHSAVHSDYATVTVAPRTLTLIHANIAVKVFDGTTAGSGTLAVTGTLPGDVVTVTGDFVWADSAAGTTNFTVKNLTVNNPNYCLAETTYQGTADNGIMYRTVTKPVADARTFTYNLREQTYALALSPYYTVAGNQQTHAGTYPVTVTLNDANYRWNDQTAEPLSFDFTIGKADLLLNVTMQSWAFGSPANTPVVTGDYRGNIIDELSCIYEYAPRGGLYGDDVPTALGEYDVKATLHDHPDFNDAVATTAFTIYQTVSDGTHRVDLTQDGNFALTVTTGEVIHDATGLTVPYQVALTRDGVAVNQVGYAQLTLLVPDAIVNAGSDGVDGITWQKGFTLSGADNYTLTTVDGVAYVTFTYHGVLPAEFVCAYAQATAAEPGTNGQAPAVTVDAKLWVGITVAAVAVVILVGVTVTIIVKIKRSPKKQLPKNTGSKQQ